MRFTRTEERADNDHWIGIALRSQGFYANLGILVYLRRNGEVAFVKPIDEMGNMTPSVLGRVKPFGERSANDFAKFDITINDQSLVVNVDELHYETELTELPHVYSQGRVLFQTLFARAGLRRIRVTEP